MRLARESIRDGFGALVGYFLAVLTIVALTGCGNVCQDIQIARTSFNFGLDGIHIAHDFHQVTAAQEAKLMPYLQAASKALDDADAVCIQEARAVAAGDTTAASSFAGQAKVLLKLALSALDSYYAMAPPPVVAAAKARAATQPSK